MPPAPESEPVPILAVAVDNLEPTTHCPACGSPSFWLAGESWRCAYCNPWPELFTGISLVLDAGRWSDGALRSQGTSDRGLIRRG